MSRNSSQVEEYEGPVGYEKKTHKTHFGVVRELRSKYKSVRDDPNWEEYAPGKFRLIKKEKDHAEV